jgi:hypothetical protein
MRGADLYAQIHAEIARAQTEEFWRAWEEAMRGGDSRADTQAEN